MRRSMLSTLAALVLVPLVGGGLALASPPAPPRIVDVSTSWGMRTWDDGTSICTLVVDAPLDHAFGKGPPVFSRGYVHFMWVGPGGGVWQESSFGDAKVGRGSTSVGMYMGFLGDTGYYVVDRVRVELLSGRGDLLSTMEVSTANTCMNG